MKGFPLLVFGLLLLSLVPAYYLNRWLLALLRPRESFWRLLLYFATSLLLVFGYTFAVVSLILRLLPHTKG